MSDASSVPVDGQHQGRTEFTEAQQVHIDKIVREVMGRAGSEAKKAQAVAEAKAAALEAEITELKAGKQGVLPEMERAHRQEVQNLQSQIKQKDEIANKYKTTASQVRAEAAIRAAAAEHGFVAVDQVVQLTSNQIRFNEENGQFEVIGPDGTAKRNNAFEPMTLDQFYKEFAVKNPHHVRSDFRPGAGSSEAGRMPESRGPRLEDVFGRASNGKLANELMKTDPQEYKRLRGLAIQKGLL